MMYFFFLPPTGVQEQKVLKMDGYKNGGIGEIKCEKQAKILLVIHLVDIQMLLT